MAEVFEGAQPQVVRGKQKYKDTNNFAGGSMEEEGEGRDALNIMYDKRVFRGNTHNINMLKSLTPAQKEEQRIKMEREKKKVEMIKQQLVEFKKQKAKASPYDLRPGDPARIEVDLTYFLQEQGREKPREIEVKCQTDQFQPKPPSPRYIPKKTGIDKITQIEDYDLFDYDREVQPILNVLLTKSVEQALLEVEEETELEEIRKFKSEYHKRQQTAHDQWVQEVKREVSRIKQKNKALNIARAKREQQVQTMHKLQCLQMSKHFLQGCFNNTMKFLAEHSYWRDSFKDQLTVTYKDNMYGQVGGEISKTNNAGGFLDQVVSTNLTNIATCKSTIKRETEDRQLRNARARAIESADERTVHFIFNPGNKVPVTPFTKKFSKMMDGSLEAFENEENTAFTGYVERYMEETLNEDAVTGAPEVCPITFPENNFFELELANLERLSFSVADNPFFKADVAKYYPECHVINGDTGHVMATINPFKKSSQQLTSLSYLDNFRDEKLKINDDRKIKFELENLKGSGIMILLTVRTFDNRGEKGIKEGAYDQAWFRLQNEDTNQALDYTKVNSIELPEGYDANEGAAAGEEGDEDAEANAGERNELIYIAGRIFLEAPKVRARSGRGPASNLDTGSQGDPDAEVRSPSQMKAEDLASQKSQAQSRGSKRSQSGPLVDDLKNARWIYERYNQVVQSSQLPNLCNDMAGLAKKARDEVKFQADEIEKARIHVAKAAEDRRIAAMAAAAKKKTTKKKGKKDDEDVPKEEMKDEVILSERDNGEPNYYNNMQFLRALKETVPRPFTFGPIRFDGLDVNDTDIKTAQEKRMNQVVDKLHEVSVLGEKRIAVLGYNVRIKGRNIKRRTTILKHSRFLHNLSVTAKIPEPEVAKADGDAEDGEAAEGDE